MIVSQLYIASDLTLFTGDCDIVFMHFVSNTFKWIYIILGMGQLDSANDLILFIGHCDLYFIVQGFCLVA